MTPDRLCQPQRGHSLQAVKDLCETAAEVSIAVCTYNRARLLGAGLASLLSQTALSERIEILIIDNGSTDKTRDVVAALQAGRPGIRYVEERRPGVAHARNRGAREARGEYLAFLDDDAWAERDWLKELLKAIGTRELEDTPACVVGPVLLDWEGKRPDWFPTELEPLLCRYDMGSEPRFLGPDAYLLTTNVLFHRPTLLELGRFRPYLGRKRGRLLGGEDNAIYHHLARAGHRVFYQPTARVHHGVPRERQSRRYFVHRLFWDGASQPLLALSIDGQQQGGDHAWRQAYRDLRQCGRLAAELMQHLLQRQQDPAWEALLSLVQRAGRLRTHIALGLGVAP
jgi:glucosyl-dolichyl phosphate glucuronosyltransferase